MKKLLIATIAMAMALVAAKTVNAQNVTVTTEAGANGSLEFFAEVQGMGVFTIELLFNEVENGTTPSRILKHVNRSGIFYTIDSSDGHSQVKADFNYNWIQGELDPANLNVKFIYRLPFEAGATAGVSFVSAHGMRFFHGNFRDFRFLQFDLPQNTPVYAVRKGSVIGTAQDSDSTYSITVEHFDGSIAQYYGIGDLKVSTGDTVTPSTVIGKAGELPTGDYGVRLGISYFATNHSNMHRGMAQRVYIDPVFMTAKGKKILAEGDKATAKTTKRLLRKECKINGRDL